MSNGKSCIQIAGAGAGKTFELANQVDKFIRTSKDYRKIYAITFTNSAKKNITDRLIKLTGSLPENVHICTVHSFLLNEIIFPFNNYVFDISFCKAVSYDLPSEYGLKNYKLKQLNSRGIIHNEQVYKKSKMIMEIKGNKIQKEKKRFLHQLLEDSISAIFIDEAQDLNDDVFYVLDELSKKDILIYMVGDPKQALMYPKSFEEFYNKNSEDESSSFNILPNLNDTWRVPDSILRISNNFCDIEQKQTSKSTITGLMRYIDINDKRFDEFYQQWNEEKVLIYIKEKKGKFRTNLKDSRHFIPEVIKDKLSLSPCGQNKDLDIWFDSIVEDIILDVEKKGLGSAISNFAKTNEIKIERNEFAEMCDIFRKEILDESSYLAISINKVKGLEAEKCVFVLDKSFIEYLLGVKKNKNAELNKLYVGLTRSKKELIFVLNHQYNFDQNKLDEWFKEHDIVKL